MNLPERFKRWQPVTVLGVREGKFVNYIPGDGGCRISVESDDSRYRFWIVIPTSWVTAK